MKTTRLIFAIFFPIIGIAQNVDQEVLQSALNFDQLIQHIQKQDIMNLSAINQIKFNAEIDTLYNLNFIDNQLNFNNGKGDVAFVSHYDIQFDKLVVKKKHAIIRYRFIPTWISCDDYDVFINQSDQLFITAELKLVKKNNEWVILSGKLEDIDFSSTDPLVHCIKEKYIQLKE